LAVRFAVFFAAEDLFAAVFFAGADFLAVVFFAAVDLFAAVFFAGADFLAVVFFAAVDLFAVVFFAAVDFLVAVFLAAVDLLAAVFLADADFLAVVFFAGDAFFAAFLVAFLAVAVARFAGDVAAARVTAGGFFAPETTFLRAAPAVNFGTAVFFALIRSPVCGLRTHRASRTRFSNEPNPVMATFSPFATSRVIVSRTDSSACCACLRFPSNRADSASMS
jgi:hypothetical protein